MPSHRPLAALALLALAACGGDTPATPETPDLVIASAPAGAQKDLAAARAATARYQDLARATADGYQTTVECVAIPGAAMGVHYVNLALIGDPALDPARPEVLLYEPQANGAMKLVGVEYMIPKALWDASNPGRRPTMFAGVAFEDGPNATYALHAWTWRQTPRGTFAPFNAQVTCPAGSGAAGHAGHH